MSVNEIKISVIMPVYNMEKYISEAIESVLRQDIIFLELICVDDGSIDGCSGIIESYTKKDVRVKYFYQRNQGSGPARNLGLRKAKGKYVSFLDPDDYYDNNQALRLLCNACDENDVLLAGGIHRTMYAGCEDRKCPVYPDFSEKTANIVSRNQNGCMLSYLDYVDTWFWNFVYNRQFLIDNNLFFPNYCRYQDVPFFCKAIWLAGSFFYVQTPIIDFRKGLNGKINLLEKNVDHILYGIRDVMVIANNSENERLYKKQIDEINAFYTKIMKNLSLDVLRILVEIYDINNSSKFKQEIKVMEGIFKGARIVSSSKKRTDYVVSEKSKKRIAAIHDKGYGIADYFKKRGITKLVIYGLGNAGLFLMNVLENEGVNAKYGMDMFVTDVEGLDVISIGEKTQELDECSAIIISIAESGHVEETLRECYKKTYICTLSKLLQDIEESF